MTSRSFCTSINSAAASLVVPARELYRSTAEKYSSSRIATLFTAMTKLLPNGANGRNQAAQLPAGSRYHEQYVAQYRRHAYYPSVRALEGPRQERDRLLSGSRAYNKGRNGHYESRISGTQP